MASERFYIELSDPQILEILSHITKEPVQSIHQICERYGDADDDVRQYDVYLVSSASGSKILKKTEPREVFNYEHYLSGGIFPVPHYFGSCEEQGSVWILLEYLPGDDLRDMTEDLAIQAADSLSRIQNQFWQQSEAEFLSRKTDDRFEVYWKRLLRRAASVADNPLLRSAYQLFLDRQLTCPRTLSNGDFLQFNAVQTDRGVTILDWGFGGILPYSLDIARFLAHATEDRATFPFYMSGGQKALFLQRLYRNLHQKPDYAQYLYDIQLATLNEYIEFMEADEDENGWYYDHATQLAREILNHHV